MASPEIAFIEQIWGQNGPTGALMICLIIAVIQLARYIKEVVSQHREDRNKWIEQTASQNERVIEALNNNTGALARLTALVEDTHLRATPSKSEKERAVIYHTAPQ